MTSGIGTSARLNGTSYTAALHLRVVFPQPVWPTTIVTAYFSRAYRIAFLCLAIGKRDLCACMPKWPACICPAMAAPSRTSSDSVARSREEPAADQSRTDQHLRARKQTLQHFETHLAWLSPVSRKSLPSAPASLNARIAVAAGRTREGVSQNGSFRFAFAPLPVNLVKTTSVPLWSFPPRLTFSSPTSSH